MKKYLISFLCLFMVLIGYGQITYVANINQTLVATPNPGTNYDLDIDQDNTADFTISMIGDINAGYANFVNGSFSSLNGALKDPSWGDAIKLNLNDSISAFSGIWTDFTADLPVIIYASGTNYAADWQDPVTDGYFGFKFDISGNIHYGWMRIDIPDNEVQMTIKDWAWNTVADAKILAGEGLTNTGVSVRGYLNSPELYPSPSSGLLNIRHNNPGLKSIEVYNNIGKRVKTITNCSTNKVDLTDLKQGFYLVHFKTPGKTHLQKIILD